MLTILVGSFLLGVCRPSCIYMMFASLQSFGSSPESTDSWKISDRLGASWCAQSFNILFGMLSGPEALDGFTCDKSLDTPSTVMLSGGMFCLAVLVVFGSSPGGSLVKTDWNCFTSISAFPLLSLTILLPDLRGAIPNESCFFYFTYFQKGFELLLFKPSSMLVFI